MKSLILKPIFILALVFTSCAYGELDSASQEALDKTINLLKDKASRDKAISESSDAQKADDYVKGLGGDEIDQQMIYELSAEIFKGMTHESKGDGKTMEEMLKKSPEEFANSFTPEQRAKLKQIADSIQKKRVNNKD